MTTKRYTLKERRRIQRRKRKLQQIMGLTTFVLAVCITISTFGRPRNEVECVEIEVEEATPNIIAVSSITNESELKMSKNESYYVKCAIEDSGFVTTDKTTTIESEDPVTYEPDETSYPKKKSKNKKEDKGEEKFVPDYCGSVHPYMGWACITDESSPQYKLKQKCENYDENGFGKVGNRYAVAMKPYYGEIGDYIDIIQNDGVEYHCIIVDYKGMENKEEDGWLATYAHSMNDIVEFVVDKESWYNTDKTVKQFHPEFSRNISKIYNVGSYWD